MAARTRFLWFVVIATAGAMSVASAAVGAKARVAVGGAGAKVPAAEPANGDSVDTATISADGRYIAFASWASNLVAGDTNGEADVFLSDRAVGTIERVDVSSSRAQAAAGFPPAGPSPLAISADGRFVAFASPAENLVSGDTNMCGIVGASFGRCRDVFVRDRLLGTTERVSVSSKGAQGNDESGVLNAVAISADGRFVAFSSKASNLVAGDTNACELPSGFRYSCEDVFVRDRIARTTERVSLTSSAVQVDGASFLGGMSGDGRYVSVWSQATLVSGTSLGGVFVRDRVARTTERASLLSDGRPAQLAWGQGASISGDGRFVAFGDLVSLFLRDRVAGTAEPIDVSSEGAHANIEPSFAYGISSDGRYVAFSSEASNLVPNDTNDCLRGPFHYNCSDVFVRDRVAGTTERVSVSSEGIQGNSGSGGGGISSDGRYVAFASSATNLAAGDANGEVDVFVRDRAAGTTTLISFGRDWTPHAGRLVLQPWPAHAGRQLTATMPVTAGGTPVTSGRLACAATLAGRKLAASTRSFRAGSARCIWKIPKTAHYKQLKGTLTITAANGTTSKRFTGTVR